MSRNPQRVIGVVVCSTIAANLESRSPSVAPWLTRGEVMLLAAAFRDIYQRTNAKQKERKGSPVRFIKVPLSSFHPVPRLGEFLLRWKA